MPSAAPLTASPAPSTRYGVPVPITKSVRSDRTVTVMLRSQRVSGSSGSSPSGLVRSFERERTQRRPSKVSSTSAFQYRGRGDLTCSSVVPSRGQSSGPYEWSQSKLISLPPNHCQSL